MNLLSQLLSGWNSIFITAKLHICYLQLFNSNTTTFFYHIPNFEQNLTYPSAHNPKHTPTVSTPGDSLVTGSLLKNHRFLELKETSEVIWSCPSLLYLQRSIFPFLLPATALDGKVLLKHNALHSPGTQWRLLQRLMGNSQLSFFLNSVASDTHHSPLALIPPFTSSLNNLRNPKTSRRVKDMAPSTGLRVLKPGSNPKPVSFVNCGKDAETC